jgi:hypothetical protein
MTQNSGKMRVEIEGGGRGHLKWGRSIVKYEILGGMMKMKREANGIELMKIRVDDPKGGNKYCVF